MAKYSLFLIFSIFSWIPLWAQQIWLEPSQYYTITGALIEIPLIKGEHFQGQSLPYDRRQTATFTLDDGKKQRKIRSRHGRNPAGMIRIIKPGIYVVGYQYKPFLLHEQTDGLGDYLKDFALEIPQTGQWNHIYCAKTLIASGKWQEQTNVVMLYNQVIGLPLELIPQQNPYQFTIGENFKLQITYKQQPLADVWVTAINRSVPDAMVKVKSDAQGNVSLPLAQKGIWLIESIYVVSAGEDEQKSFSTSLTFEVMPSDPYANVKLPVILQRQSDTQENGND